MMPHLREENEYWRTPEFIEFTGRPEYRVLKFLMAQNVREPKGSYMPPGAKRIHRDFFKKRMLCASYSEKNIAKFFGWKSNAYVSRLVKKLEQMKMLQIKTIPTPIGKRNVYLFGFYKGTFGEDDYGEMLFFDVYFSELAKNHKIKKLDEKINKFKSDCSQDHLNQIKSNLVFMDEKRRIQK
jgi:hypothetical protein